MINFKAAANLTALVATSLVCVGHSAFAAGNNWQRISAPQQATVTVNGNAREIHPSCAFDGDDYSFYFKPGKSDKLVIFFNGGGACWNATTCLASLQTATPAYVPTDEINLNNPIGQDGLLNLNNPDNPYKDWSIAYLPYCTGDVHFASKDVSYGGTTIHHRGFDNFLYAREWIEQHFASIGATPGKVLVAGSSAGAYGAALNYDYIKASFPNAKGFLIGDGGVGVLEQGFMNDAISGSTSSWNVDANLPPNRTHLTAGSADSLIPALYSALSSSYPKDRFSQYTTVHDLVQVLFYNIMVNSNEISQWNNPTPGLFEFWTTSMLTNAFYQAAVLPNYRYFIAPGCQHTILRSAAMYSTTVDEVSFLDWAKELTRNNKNNNWSNRSCTEVGCQSEPEDFSACSPTL